MYKLNWALNRQLFGLL
ncbi:hypothetical protein Pint_05454 [Pistacia integerrima]|uniref:Uncharacterized protein n=1 Tax=Pistacia integerrima TaxID=434235 RepID=A0ACC0Z5N1_9ROSI|nr:hypothetical protein Pint_36734 [Pistacia integerrima]KAJ0045680.1 hypothetical protein Pint_05454 [Pistacia integerrima]